MVWGIIAAIIAVATSAASYMQAKKAEKLAAKQAEEMAAVQISGHNNNRSLYTVYGKALVGSTVVWKKLSGKRVQLPATNFLVKSAASGNDLTSQDSDTPKRYLYRAVTLCNGPVQDVTEVLVDGESYLSARFKQEHNRHFGTAISKGPTTGLYYNRLKNYSATDFAQWDSTKLGKGVAYAMERLYLDKDKPAFQGEPSTQYIVKGRLLYDPRLDSTVTGGSGSHRSANSATWAYSDNPVLALLDYVTNAEYGRGLAHTDIDLASMITCANACDVLVDIPPRLINGVDGFTIWINGEAIVINSDFVFPQYREEQDSSTNKQKRYRINVAIDGSKEILDNIQQILNVFKGNLIYVNGKYKCVMADVASSVLSITDDDIIGGLTISDGDRSQRMNRATIKFTNENKDYKVDQVSWPEIGTSEYNAYLAEDQNEKLHRTFTIDGCTDYYQAEDTAEFIVREGRSGLTVSGTFGSRALALTPGDVVAITYDSASYSNKYFRVQTVALNIQTMNVNLTLREYDSSVYTWNPNKGNEPLGFSWHEEPVNLAPTSPSIGTITTTNHSQADGTAVLIMTVPFTGVPEQAHRVEVSASVQSENKYTTVNVSDLENESSAAISLSRGGLTYDVRVRYIIVDANGTHLPSAYVRTTHAVPALASTIGTNVTTAIADAASAQAAADGKIDSFYQNEPPSSAGEGDIWFDTNDGNKIYTRRSGAWVATQDSAIAAALQDAADADAKADGKVTTFYQVSAPTAEGTGDLWVDTDDGNKLYRWSGSAWVSVQDTSIAAAQLEAEKKYASFFRVTITSGTSVAAPTDSAFATQFGRAPIEHDQLVVTNTATTPDTQAAYVRGSSSWGSAVDNFMSGDLIVDGSIGADHLTVTSLAAISADMGTITAGSMSVGLLTGDVTEVYPLMLYLNTTLSTTDTAIASWSLPAPSLSLYKRQKLSFNAKIELKNSNNATPSTNYISFDVQKKSKGVNAQNIGTVTLVSYSSYQGLIYLSGNKLDVVDGVGGISDSGNAGSSNSVLGVYYDASTNRTYINYGAYPNPFATGDTCYYSDSKFTAAGTWVTPSDGFTYAARVPEGSGAIVTMNLPIELFFGQTNTATDFRILSEMLVNITSGHSFKVEHVRGTMENIA